MKKNLATLFLLMTCILCSATGFANPAIKNLTTDATLLFIQVAKSGEIEAIRGQDQYYKITLNQVEPFTSYFTDRPNRKTGFMPTTVFINTWQQLQDIKQTPPNVAIETFSPTTHKHINHVFEFTQPSYDPKTKKLTYIAKSLQPESFNLYGKQKMKINYTVIFIDDFHWNGNRFGH